VKDVTSDIAVVSRKGSALLKDQREKRERNKMRYARGCCACGCRGRFSAVPFSAAPCHSEPCRSVLCHRKRFWELGGSKMGDAIGIRAPVDEDEDEKAQRKIEKTLQDGDAVAPADGDADAGAGDGSDGEGRVDYRKASKYAVTAAPPCVVCEACL
jgi:hypothetical protein